MPSLPAQRFWRHAHHYQHHAIIQRKMAYKLIHIWQEIGYTPQHIFEFGSGEGSYTRLLADLFPRAHFVCNDINDYAHSFEDMPNVRFLCFDMNHATKALRHYDSFNLITANAALQWLHQAQCLRSLPRFLCPRGYILLSSFGTRNFWQIRELCGVGLPYLSIDEYAEILTRDFEILHLSSQQHTLRFGSALEVFRHLHYSGVNGIQKGFFLGKKILSAYTQKFANTLTYDCVFICAKKKD